MVIGTHPAAQSVFICPACQNIRYKLLEVDGRWCCYRCHGLTHASRHVHRAAFFDGDAFRLDWMLEAKRLAACGLGFYQIAMRDNDPQAAMIFIKASERRATLMGANAPAAASVKLIHEAKPEEHQTSTQRIRAVHVMGITARERELTDRHELDGDDSPELLAELDELRTAREQARAARQSTKSN